MQLLLYKCDRASTIGPEVYVRLSQILFYESCYCGGHDHSTLTMVSGVTLHVAEDVMTIAGKIRLVSDVPAPEDPLIPLLAQIGKALAIANGIAREKLRRPG